MSVSKQTCFVDTNLFLRLLVKEDEKTFSDCSEFFEKIRQGLITAYTSNIVIAEMVWVMTSFYKLKKEDIVSALEGIYTLHGLAIIDNYNYLNALDMFRSSSVKYTDCLIASIEQIKDKSWLVVSYDKDFDKLGVLRKEPHEIA